MSDETEILRRLEVMGRASYTMAGTRGLLADAADHIQDLTKQLAWISVDERLPEDDGEYFVRAEGHWKGFYVANRSSKLWLHYADDNQGITHWMPIPTLPQEPI